MKKVITRILGIFLLIIVVAFLLNIRTIKKLHHVMTLFDEKNIVDNFLHMENSFKCREIEKSSDPFIFPRNISFTPAVEFIWNDSVINTQNYLDYTNTTGLLVIHRDTIIYEDYFLGNTESTTHISWSMAKSFVSALVGIALSDKRFDSIDDPITKYLPQFKGTGYDNVKIKDILQMSSGVGFNEDYRDFNSDINRFGRYFALGKSFEDFALSLEREKEPGTFNHYVSINTQVLGMLVAKVTGEDLSDYLKEKIWDPLGMEYNAQWIIDNTGMEMALGGLNVTLRDYGKFGWLYLNKGRRGDVQIVPEEWIEMSVRADEPYLQAGNPNTSNPEFSYGYQWWIPEPDEGDFLAAGIYNQFIYVFPAKDLVIVKTSANYHFKEKGDQSKLQHMALLKTLAHQIPDKAIEDVVKTDSLNFEMN